LIRDLAEDRKIISLSDRSKAVFVGDTHGDFESSKKVWDSFKSEVRNGETYLVFLGDYVDRGEESKKNIDFLLEKKERYQDGLILLLGNHDAFHKRKLRPSDFWSSLTDDEYEKYKNLFHLPWVARANGLLSSHGALPFISDYGEMDDLEKPFEVKNDLGFPAWISTTWGDFSTRISGAKMDSLSGRPQFGKEKLLEYLKKHEAQVLIRAHQPSMQGWAFSNNLLTIFTSQAYVEMGRAYEKNIAIVDLNDGVRGESDVLVKSLSNL